MRIPIRTVDAFSEVPFKGNPAAVCLLDEAREAEWMQGVAREMNLSETAFLVPGEGGFDLRWFTPAAEVDLCGHATLASAHVLWEEGRLAEDEPAVFFTRSGRLGAARRGEWIELDFPAVPPRPAPAPGWLEEVLRCRPLCFAESSLYPLAEVGSEDDLRRLDPDLVRLAGLVDTGLIVTCGAASAEHDFVSRFYAPALGIDEDPVTGSAHCVLGPFWAERLGRDALTAYQASPRGGVVRVRVAGERVFLGGRAVTVLRGELV